MSTYSVVGLYNHAFPKYGKHKSIMHNIFAGFHLFQLKQQQLRLQYCIGSNSLKIGAMEKTVVLVHFRD